MLPKATIEILANFEYQILDLKSQNKQQLTELRLRAEVKSYLSKELSIKEAKLPPGCNFKKISGHTLMLLR